MKLSNQEELYWQQLQTMLGQDYVVSPQSQLHRGGGRRVVVTRATDGAVMPLDLTVHRNVARTGPVVTVNPLTGDKQQTVIRGGVAGAYFGNPEESNIDESKFSFHGTSSLEKLGLHILEGFELVDADYAETPQAGFGQSVRGEGKYPAAPTIGTNVTESAFKRSLQKLSFSIGGKGGAELPPHLQEEVKQRYYEGATSRRGVLSSAPGDFTWEQLRGIYPGKSSGERGQGELEPMTDYIHSVTPLGPYYGEMLNKFGASSQHIGSRTTFPLERFIAPSGAEGYRRLFPRTIGLPGYVRGTSIFPGETKPQEFQTRNVLFMAGGPPGGAYKYVNPTAPDAEAWGHESTVRAPLPVENLKELLTGNVGLNVKNLMGQTMPEGRGEIDLGSVTKGGVEYPIIKTKGEAPLMSRGTPTYLEIPAWWDPKTGKAAASEKEGESTAELAKQIQKLHGIEVRRGSGPVQLGAEVFTGEGYKERGWGEKWGKLFTGIEQQVDIGTGRQPYLDLATGEAKTPAIAFSVFASRTPKQMQGIMEEWATQTGNIETKRLATWMGRTFGGDKPKPINWERTTKEWSKITGQEQTPFGLMTDVFSNVFLNYDPRTEEGQARSISNIQRFGAGYLPGNQSINVGAMAPEQYQLQEALGVRAIRELQPDTTEAQAKELFGQYIKVGEGSVSDVIAGALRSTLKGQPSLPQATRQLSPFDFYAENMAGPAIGIPFGGPGRVNIEAQMALELQYKQIAQETGLALSQEGNASKIRRATQDIVGFASYTKQAATGEPIIPEGAETISEEQLLAMSKLTRQKDVSPQQYIEEMKKIVSDPNAYMHFPKTSAIHPPISAIENLAYEEYGEQLSGWVGRSKRAVKNVTRQELKQQELLDPVGKGVEAMKPLSSYAEGIIERSSDFIKHAWSKELTGTNLAGTVSGYQAGAGLAPGEMYLTNRMKRQILRNAGIRERNISRELKIFEQADPIKALLMRYPQSNLGSLAAFDILSEKAYSERIGPQAVQAIEKDPAALATALVDEASLSTLQAGDLDIDQLLAMVGAKRKGQKMQRIKSFDEISKLTAEETLAGEARGYPDPRMANRVNAFVQSFKDVFSMNRFGERGKLVMESAMGKRQLMNVEEIALGAQKASEAGLRMGIPFNAITRGRILAGSESPTDLLMNLSSASPSAYSAGLDALLALEERHGSRASAAVSKVNFGVNEEKGAYLRYTTNVKNKDAGGYPEIRTAYLGDVKGEETVSTFLQDLVADVTSGVNVPDVSKDVSLESPESMGSYFAMPGDEEALTKKLQGTERGKWSTAISQYHRGLKQSGEDIEAYQKRLFNIPAMHLMASRATAKSYSKGERAESATEAKEQFQEWVGPETAQKWETGSVMHDWMMRNTYGSIAAGRLAEARENLPQNKIMAGFINRVSNVLRIPNLKKTEQVIEQQAPPSKPAYVFSDTEQIVKEQLQKATPETTTEAKKFGSKFDISQVEELPFETSGPQTVEEQLTAADVADREGKKQAAQNLKEGKGYEHITDRALDIYKTALRRAGESDEGPITNRLLMRAQTAMTIEEAKEFQNLTVKAAKKSQPEYERPKPRTLAGGGDRGGKDGEPPDDNINPDWDAGLEPEEPKRPKKEKKESLAGPVRQRTNWGPSRYDDEVAVQKGYLAARRFGPQSKEVFQELGRRLGVEDLSTSGGLFERFGELLSTDPEEAMSRLQGMNLSPYLSAGKAFRGGRAALHRTSYASQQPGVSEALYNKDYEQELAELGRFAGALDPKLFGKLQEASAKRGDTPISVSPQMRERFAGLSYAKDVMSASPDELNKSLTALKDTFKDLTERTDTLTEKEKVRKESLGEQIKFLEKVSDMSDKERSKESARLGTEIDKTVAGMQTESARQRVQALRGEIIGGEPTHKTFQEYGTARKELEQLQEVQQAQAQAETPMGRFSNRFGGWARRVFGGFGLMYMGSIARIATQGLGFGQEQRMGLEEQIAAGQNMMFGTREIPLNQQQMLQNQIALAGTNNNPITALQMMGAQNQGIRAFGGGIGAGVSVAGMAAWLGAGAAAIPLGAVAGLGAIGLETYSRTQDPRGLGYRLGTTDFQMREEGRVGGLGLRGTLNMIPDAMAMMFMNEEQRGQVQVTEAATRRVRMGLEAEDSFRGMTQGVDRQEAFNALVKQIIDQTPNISQQAAVSTAQIMARSQNYAFTNQERAALTADFNTGGQAQQISTALQSAFGTNIAGQMLPNAQGLTGLDAMTLQLAQMELPEARRTAMLTGAQGLQGVRGIEYVTGGRTPSEQMRLAEQYGAIVGTREGDLWANQMQAWDLARSAGLNVAQPNMPVAHGPEGYTPVEMTQQQLAFANIQAGNLTAKANRILSLEPMALAAASLSGFDLANAPGMTTLGGQTIGAEYRAMTDIGLNGQLTGMNWGTSSFQLGNVSGQDMARRLFGNNWQNNTMLSSGLIGAGVSGFNLNAPITLPTGETISSVGGMMGMQMYQNQANYNYQMAQLGLQSKQLDLTQNYQTQSWGVQDQLRDLSREQQRWQFGFQERQLSLSNQQWQQNFAMQQQQSLRQREWTREDWGWNAETRNLQWGWKQEDFAENLRFMTGRERRLAERQMGRETIMHDREGEQLDRQKNRQEELWRMEDERFKLQQEQHAETLSMQEEQLKKSEEYFEERAKLEDEATKIQRQYAQENMKIQREQLELTQQHAKENLLFQNTMLQLQIAMEHTQAAARTLADDALEALLQKFMEFAGIDVSGMGVAPVSASPTQDANWFEETYYGGGDTTPLPTTTTTTTTGGGGGGACFVAGTLVTMADCSHKAIEDITIGDVVLSYDTETHTYVKAEVEYTFHHTPEEVNVTLIINGIIETTPEHMFYVNGEWKKALLIKLHDTLIDVFGNEVEVTSLDAETKHIPTFNLHTKDDTHNYFANSILVHNTQTKMAEGGILAEGAVTMTGEKGWEFVIGNEVVPHETSKKLWQQGVRPGASGMSAMQKIDKMLAQNAEAKAAMMTNTPDNTMAKVGTYTPIKTSTSSEKNVNVQVFIGSEELKGYIVKTVESEF